tara:strand:+ start:1372 stop:1551 length:180 start_codon:yes stop_codon:yes gene_type:complete
MKEITKLKKLQFKLEFHKEYHRGIISDIIIQGLNKLIEKELLLTNNYEKNNKASSNNKK